jgi:hypothetical protein
MAVSFRASSLRDQVVGEGAKLKYFVFGTLSVAAVVLGLSFKQCLSTREAARAAIDVSAVETSALPVASQLPVVMPSAFSPDGVSASPSPSVRPPPRIAPALPAVRPPGRTSPAAHAPRAPKKPAATRANDGALDSLVMGDSDRR